MKKILLTLLILCTALLTLPACKTDEKNSDEKLKIVASIFPQYDFARELTKGKADISMLVTPGAETHGFEPTVSHMKAIADCDIFIYTGGDSDSWINSLLDSVDNPDMTVISLVDIVKDGEDHETHDHSHEGHSHFDEHVWTSPENSIEICNEITRILMEKDPVNADFYETNLERYIKELQSLDEGFREITENSVRNTLVFADRFPLTHFAHHYHLEHFAAFSGCSDDTEPSASTVASLIDKVNAESIPVVFKIELSSDSIAKTVANETDAEILTFYSCHNISKEDFEKGETYISLMEKNIESLKTALC